MTQTAGGTKVIDMTKLYGVEIDQLLRLLSREAGVTIVRPEEVKGQVTIIAPEPVPLDVAFDILNSALSVRDFTLIRSPTGVYKVVPTAKAMQQGPPVAFGGRPEDIPLNDSIITQVIPLTNLDAADMATQVKPLLWEKASVIPTSTNSLIITDTAANIQRVVSIIADTESQLSGGLRVFSLQYYSSDDMADVVNATILAHGGGGAAAAGGAAQAAAAAVAQRRRAYERGVAQPLPTGAPGARVSPAASLTVGAGPEYCYSDSRTNRIIVLATPVHLEQIQSLIDQLDHPVSLRGTSFSYAVQNVTASELAQLVGPLIGAQVSGTTAGTAGRAGTAATSRAGQQTSGGFMPPGYGTTGQTGGGGRYRPQSYAPGPAGAPPLSQAPSLEVDPLAGTATAPADPEAITIAQAPQGAVPAVPQLPPWMLGGGMPFGAPQAAAPAAGASAAQATVTADDNTNTLLISGSPEQQELIRDYLEKLDVPVPQVYIQAIIAEVTLARDTSLGFQFESLGRTFGQFGKQATDLFTGNVGADFGLIPTDTKPSGFFGQISGPEFEAALTALTTDIHARILSTPSIFTSNNQEAQIDVSSSRPFPRGTLTTAAAGTTTNTVIGTSIEYQSVGIVLTVTPRVTQGNVVQMDVQVSADEPGASIPIAGQSYPTVNRRMTRGVLSVNDGYTVVLGGLMRDTITRTGSRVPLLGDLPLIGAFFRSTTSKREKSELLVFLTPHVVRGPGEAAAISEMEKKKLGEVPRSLRGPSAPAPTPEAEKK